MEAIVFLVILAVLSPGPHCSCSTGVPPRPHPTPDSPHVKRCRPSEPVGGATEREKWNQRHSHWSISHPRQLVYTPCKCYENNPSYVHQKKNYLSATSPLNVTGDVSQSTARVGNQRHSHWSISHPRQLVYTPCKCYENNPSYVHQKKNYLSATSPLNVTGDVSQSTARVGFIVLKEWRQGYTCETSLKCENIESRTRLNMEAIEHEDELEVPLREPVLHEVIEPLPSQLEPLATPGADRARRTRERRRSARASRAPTAQPSVSHQTPPAPQVQSARSALDESRKMVMKIEELKAQTALENAQAANKNAQAAHETAVAFNTLSQSFKLIAESIDRMSRQYCASQAIQQQPE